MKYIEHRISELPNAQLLSTIHVPIQGLHKVYKRCYLFECTHICRRSNYFNLSPNYPHCLHFTSLFHQVSPHSVMFNYWGNQSAQFLWLIFKQLVCNIDKQAYLRLLVSEHTVQLYTARAKNYALCFQITNKRLNTIQQMNTEHLCKGHRSGYCIKYSHMVRIISLSYQIIRVSTSTLNGTIQNRQFRNSKSLYLYVLKKVKMCREEQANWLVR